jgi:hypothetical protein
MFGSGIPSNYGDRHCRYRSGSHFPDTPSSKFGNRGTSFVAATSKLKTPNPGQPSSLTQRHAISHCRTTCYPARPMAALETRSKAPPSNVSLDKRPTRDVVVLCFHSRFVPTSNRAYVERSLRGFADSQSPQPRPCIAPSRLPRAIVHSGPAI